MREQFLGSVAVGLAVSALMFLPVVVWQYRRYGRFDATRMAWTIISFVYVSGVIAFTIFPLPAFSDAFCAARRTHPQFDLLNFPRQLADLIDRSGLRVAATSFLVREVVLNVLLFVPFGVIVRRVFEWPRWGVLAAALGTSLLIETTQLTGNWGLAQCPYRVADVTDLVTNTSGAALGLLLEAWSPRLISRKAYLLAERDRARPVTRARRWMGMVLDAWLLGLFMLFAAWCTVIVLSVTAMPSQGAVDDAALLRLTRIGELAAVVAGLVGVLAPALFGTGASLGQRIVHLAPSASRQARWQLVARALVVQGVLVLGGLRADLGLATTVWALADAVCVAFRVQGLSGLLTGCTMRDSREVAADEGPAATDDEALSSPGERATPADRASTDDPGPDRAGLSRRGAAARR